MKTLLENIGLSVYEYKEDGKLCGYEISTYTDGGVNIVVFLDFRGEDKDLNNKDKVKEKFLDYLNDFDIDEEIDLYRQCPEYRNSFTISQSVKDFKSWKKEMKKVISKL